MASKVKAPTIAEGEANEGHLHVAPEGTKVLVTGPEGLTMETEVGADGRTEPIPEAFSPATIQVLLED